MSARILLIEDSANVRELFSLILSRAGYAVETARDGGEALLCVGKRRPDLIILDLMMAPISGWDFLAVKANVPSLHQVPVLVISGHHPLPQMGPPHVCRIMMKPVEPDTLLQEVRRALKETPEGAK